MTAEQTALDLLNKGGCSVAMLGGELVKRRLVPAEHSIGMAYRIARETLDGMSSSGKCKKWPDGTCYTLPDSTTFEKTKDPT